MIEFPFQRGRPYTLRDLRAFESDLLVARQRDKELSKLLRNPRGSAPSWMRLRNKELVPLRLFADHICASDNDKFLLKPEGDPVDAQLVVGCRALNLQLTLAAPLWGDTKDTLQNSGYQHHQIMVALNEADCVIGYPPFTFEGGDAIGAIDAISNEDRDRACRRGLEVAVANKASHDGRGCILAVFAQEFYRHLLEVHLLDALVDRVLNAKRLSFDSICVFDSHPSFFVERRRLAAG